MYHAIVFVHKKYETISNCFCVCQSSHEAYNDRKLPDGSQKQSQSPLNVLLVHKRKIQNFYETHSGVTD